MACQTRAILNTSGHKAPLEQCHVGTAQRNICFCYHHIHRTKSVQRQRQPTSKFPFVSKEKHCDKIAVELLMDDNHTVTQQGTALTCSQPYKPISSITGHLLRTHQPNCPLCYPFPQHNETAPFLQGLFVCPVASAQDKLRFFRWFQRKIRDYFKFHVSLPAESQDDAGGCGNKSKRQQWPEAEQAEDCPVLLLQTPSPSHKVEDQKVIMGRRSLLLHQNIS